MFSIAWLHDAGSRGEIADITGHLRGNRTELDYPGRGPGDSKLKLLKTSGVGQHIEAGNILPGDLLLILDTNGELVKAGQLTPKGHLRRISVKKSFPGLSLGCVTWRKAGAYCKSFRKAAGVKVLREPWFPFHYTKREEFVPMRDGVKLYTAIYEASGEGPKPIIMMRSTYNLGTYGNGGVGDLWDGLHCFTDRGYIIVEQNVRGTYMSEGDFVDLRPLGGPTDEATDTYDTIDWLLANTDNNGSVGIYGVSYPGFYASLSAVCGHPALKAVSPQAPVTDWWNGDDVHHNGAFMLADIYGFGSFFFRPKGNPTPDSQESLVEFPDGVGMYDFYRGKAMRDLMAPVKHLETFAQFIAHPANDSFWRDRTPLKHLAMGVKPAVMVVGGLYDAEDAWGAAHTWETLKPQADKNGSCFVFGPWPHDNWRKDNDFLERVEIPFFEYWLEGKGEKPSWKEIYMASGAGVQGENLNPGKELLVDISASGQKSFALEGASYVSDPATPVPFSEGDAASRRRPDYWADQRFVAERPDVLTQTVQGPLDEEFFAFGPVKVDLRFSLATLDGRDADNLEADFVVKLIDVDPDGTQYLVRADVFPTRWRNSDIKAEALRSGEEAELKFELVKICHRFAPGHSIMVQVQSSWFPIVAMNPQTFLQNPFDAAPEDYRPIRVNLLPGSTITVPFLFYPRCRAAGAD